MLPRYSETNGVPMICPSILSADFAKLGEDVRMVSRTADLIHIDVMDGHYVPNLTLGPVVVEAIRSYSDLPFDVHLMVNNPGDWLSSFAEAGADTLVFHYEAVDHAHRLLQQIRELGCTPGISINPGTPLNVLEEVLPYVDLVLLMTVNPGFGGQSFIPTMPDKIRRLRRMIDERGLDVHIQVDGGVNRSTVRTCYEAGANLLVAGSACFGADDPAEEVNVLRKLAIG